MRVVIAGGGTGGHVFPALALADRLVGDHGAEVSFIGASSGPEARLVPEAGYVFHPVEAAPLYRELSLRALRAPLVAMRSVRAARPLVKGADVVVGVGGYVSVPPGLAARRVRVPLVIHEQNAVPSLANRLLGRRARAIGLTFEDAARRISARAEITVTGNPVRASILEVVAHRGELAAEARELFGFEEHRATVVVFGGSQGALHLDETVAAAFPLLADRGDVQMLVMTGQEHLEVVAAPAASTMDLRVHVLSFLDRMELAYAVADLAVSRAGATSIAEMTVCGIPMVLVPYPFATENHQEANARELERAGARRRGTGPRSVSPGAGSNDHRDRGRPGPTAAHGCRLLGLGQAGRGPAAGVAGDEGGRAMSTYTPPPGSIPTLPVPSLTGVDSVHLIGVGGAGMRNLARLLLARKVAVTGSDLKDSRGLDELRSLGASVWVGHDASRLGTPDVVIISSAIRETNPELARARSAGIPIWARQQALAALAFGLQAIAVAGTHGKTTTTSMVAIILERAGMDPSYLIGGDLNESGSGARSGRG